MKLAIVTQALAPYNAAAPECDSLKTLLPHLVRRGFAVHLISWVPTPAAAQAHAFARRLKPVQLPGDAARFLHFEGHEASGAEVHLLVPEAPSAAAEALFPAAAEALIEALPIAFDHLLSWNNAVTFESVQNRPQTVSIIDDNRARLDTSGIFDRIFVHGRARGDALLPGEPTLRQMLDLNTAAIIPCWVPEKHRVTADEKRSGKARFQSLFGLPIRTDAPLVYIEDAAADALPLARALTRDLQIALRQTPAHRELLEALAADYPDRLVLLPESADPADIIPACDFAALTTRACLARLALACGTVPLCPAALLDAPVDLAPDLSNGNSFLFGDAPHPDFEVALGRALGAFSQPHFAQLPARLAAQAFAANDAASVYERILRPAGEP